MIRKLSSRTPSRSTLQSWRRLSVSPHAGPSRLAETGWPPRKGRVNRRLIRKVLGAVLLTSSVGIAIPSAGANSIHILLPTGQDCNPSLKSRPTDITLGCADGSEYLGSLKWSDWGPKSAVGSGELMKNSCIPNCANGSIVSSGDIRVEATSVELLNGHDIFTRLKVTTTAARSYALLSWNGRSGPTARWNWITPNFVPAASAKGLIFDTTTMHLDGVPPIADAPDIIMNAVESEVVYALAPRLGPPRVFASTICHGALRVTVDQWQDLSLVFEGGISVLMYYNYLGWTDAQSSHPALPPSVNDLWPKLTTNFGVGIGTTLSQAHKIDPLLRGSVGGGFTDGRMSLFAVSPSTRGSSTSTSQYVISQIGAAGGNC